MVSRLLRAAARLSAPVMVCWTAACGTPEGSAAGGDAEGTRASSAPQLVIFVYDRSTSISNHQLVLARQLTNDRIRKLDHGDRISAHQLLQLSLEEPPRRWSETVPSRQWTGQEMARDSLVRVRFLRDAQDYLVAFTDTMGREDINGTDILSTLHDVAADLRAAPNREATMYIFSDMLQSNRVVDMEGLRLMPPDGWVKRQKELGTLPDLSGLCVLVVGARVDTDWSQRVKAFWGEYFGETGAVLQDVNYTLRPVELREHPCI